MVNPGTFRGTRKVFLKGELVVYAATVEGGFVADGVALIARRYFKRYPVELPLDEEPSPQHLAAVDDEAIDPDEPPMDHTELSLEEFIQQGISREERAALIVYRHAVSICCELFDLEAIAHLFHSRSNAGCCITIRGCVMSILAKQARIVRIGPCYSSSPARDTSYPVSNLRTIYGAPGIATESTSWRSWTR